MKSLALFVFAACLLQANAFATVIIHDDFDDGNLATNTTGTGSGFTDWGQNASSESGGNLVMSPTTPSATTVVDSTDKFNPFLNGTTTRTTWSITNASRSFSQYRTWVGLRTEFNSPNDHFLPAQQGIFISIFQFQNDVLGAGNVQGNLVSANGSTQTVLASWNWDNFTTNSGLLDIILETDDSNYSLSLSQSISLVSGSLSGALAGIGTLGGNFEVGAHNQWPGNTLSIDSITVETLDASIPLPGVLGLMLLGLAGLRARNQSITTISKEYRR